MPPDITTALAIAKREFNASVVRYGSVVRFVQANGGPQFDVRAGVRGLKPDEYEIADLTQHDFRLKCRVVEFEAAGVEPVPGDVFHIRGLDRMVLGVLPLDVADELVGYAVNLRG